MKVIYINAIQVNDIKTNVQLIILAAFDAMKNTFPTNILGSHAT